jgi:hypothetical protein
LTRDVEPLWIARYDYEPLWHLPRHAHDDYFQIILIVSGTGEAVVGADRSAFGAGQLLFFLPRLAHSLTARPTAPVRTLGTKFHITAPTCARPADAWRPFMPASTNEWSPCSN